MSDEAPVVWLDEGEAREDAVRALGEWARARGIRLGVLEERSPAIRIDPLLGERAEKELDRAREAISATDAANLVKWARDVVNEADARDL